jgi:N-acetyl-anhydromuramyl-L-alanine amidase AmpD
MNIKDYKLDFQPLADRLYTNNIIIHHSASDDVSAPEIHQWHRDRGYSGIGYHFVIRKYGTIERGRPIDKIGAHAGEANNDSIGVCLAGNFVSREPEIEQIQALLSLTDYLEDHYGKPLPLLRHCDVTATVCPGNMFPWPLPGRAPEQWKQKLVDQALQERLITEVHDPDAPADKWFVLAVALNLLGRV